MSLAAVAEDGQWVGDPQPRAERNASPESDSAEAAAAAPMDAMEAAEAGGAAAAAAAAGGGVHVAAIAGGGAEGGVNLALLANEPDPRANVADARLAAAAYAHALGKGKAAAAAMQAGAGASASPKRLLQQQAALDRRACAHSPPASSNVLVYELPSLARTHLFGLNAMRTQRLLCDVSLCVGGGGDGGGGDAEIAAHRSVLASASPYFYAMFTGEMSEASLHVRSVSIHGVEARALRLLVEFAYTSVIEVREDNVQHLLPAARLLQLESVVSACCHFLEAELHPANCLGVKQFADVHSCDHLLQAADAFSKRRFTEVCRYEEFLELSVKDAVELMSADDLGVKSEEQVFEAALSWLHYSGDDGDESDIGCGGSSRRAHIGKVMAAVRLPMCTKHFLVRCADKDEMLRASDDYKDLLIEALKYQLISPSERVELARSLPDNWRIRDRHRGSLPHILMVIGGQAPKAVRSVEKCDLGTVQWSYSTDLNSRRCRCGVAVMHDTVYAIGGFDGSSRVRSVEVYDVRQDSWQIIAGMNVRRSTLGAAMLGGLIYAVGGFDGSVGLDTVERYNAAKNEWTMVASMSVRRSSVGVAAMGGYLYALGGYDGVTRHCLSSVECYDMETDKWRTVADMNQTRSGAAVAVAGDLLYAIGGHDGPDIRKSVEVYEAVSDTWSLCAPMICARRNAGAVAVDSMIYVVGGDDGTSNLSSVEMFDPQANAWYMLTGSLQVGRSYAAITAIERPLDDEAQTRQQLGSEHELIRWK